MYGGTPLQPNGTVSLVYRAVSFPLVGSLRTAYEGLNSSRRCDEQLLCQQGDDGLPQWFDRFANSREVLNYVTGFGDGAYRAMTLGLGDLQGIRDLMGISGPDPQSNEYQVAGALGSLIGVVATAGGVSQGLTTQVHLMYRGTGAWYRAYPNVAGGGIGLDISGANLIRADMHWIRSGGQSVFRPHIDSQILGIRHWPWPR